MIRLATSVEGRTEEEFVKLVLAEHLGAKGVEPQPVFIGKHGNMRSRIERSCRPSGYRSSASELVVANQQPLSLGGGE